MYLVFIEHKDNFLYFFLSFKVAIYSREVIVQRSERSANGERASVYVLFFSAESAIQFESDIFKRSLPLKHAPLINPFVMASVFNFLRYGISRRRARLPLPFLRSTWKLTESRLQFMNNSNASAPEISRRVVWIQLE